MLITLNGGPKAETQLANSSADIIALAEHHLPRHATGALTQHMKRHGYTTFCQPARKGHGGTALSIKTRHKLGEIPPPQQQERSNRQSIHASPHQIQNRHSALRFSLPTYIHRHKRRQPRAPSRTRGYAKSTWRTLHTTRRFQRNARGTVPLRMATTTTSHSSHPHRSKHYMHARGR